jgi:hypothetical protein
MPIGQVIGRALDLQHAFDLVEQLDAARGLRGRAC